MRKWQPPIPAGAFCSPEAIKINTALPLLGWCYDEVGKDGWLELNLHGVAGEIDVPYHTVKKWWGALRGSDFIAEIDEHGRKGMRIRLASHWIDWRIIQSRETVPNPVPNIETVSVIGTETGPSVVPNTSNRDRNGTGIVPDQVPNNSAYKVPMTHDQAGGGRDQDRTEHSPPHPAVLAYRQAFPHIRLTSKQEAIISALVGERVEHLECWREVIQDYELSTIWRPENIGNMRSRFEKKLKERDGQKNAGGQRPADSRPALKPFVSPIPADANSAEENMRKLLATRGQKP